MGILSTNHKLINIGHEYSAGENISISEDYVISSKDWSEEISQATSSVSGDVSALSAAIDYVSANAGHEYVGISPIGVDNSTYTISADSWVFSAGSGISLVDDNANKVTRIDVTANGGDVEVENLVKTNSGSWNTVGDKLDATAFTNWQDGQYATDLQTIEGQISNKLDTTAFSTVSGSFLTAINIPESATWNEVSQAYEQNSGTYLTSHQSLEGYATQDWVQDQGYLTEVSIPESAVWQDVSTTVQSNSAQWSDNTGDEEVNSFVYNNSATINEVNTSYQTNSGNFLTAVNIPESATWNDVSTTVQTNSASWNDVTSKQDNLTFGYDGQDKISAINNSAIAGGGGGGGSYVSPSGSIWISSNNIESTDSAYIPSHPEDVLLTAITSWSSMNGYATLANTNKVYFIAQANRASAFDNEGTFLNSSYNSTVLAETEYPPIKLYTNTWVSVKYSAYSAGIMDAYVVELARKNDVNSALNTKLDSSAFKGYYPSNNPSGFAKASDAVMTSSLNLFDGRVVGVNNQYLMGCDSAYNCTLVGTSAATATKTASAYVGTGHQGITIQVSARTRISNINWTAFGEDGSNLSAGQLSWPVTSTNKTNSFTFVSPLAENISGVKLYGNSNPTTTAYSAYTIDVKQLASQDNITFLSGAVDYVSANAGGEFPVSADEAIQYVQTNSANIDDTVTSYQTNSGDYLKEVSHDNTLSGKGTVDSPLGVVPGYNETVLWSGAAAGNITLSEPCTNFEKLELTTTNNEVITIKVAEQNFSLIFCPAANTNYGFFSFVNFTLSGSSITTNVCQVLNAGAYNAGTPTMTWDKSSSFKSWCVKVIGINRKA